VFGVPIVVPIPVCDHILPMTSRRFPPPWSVEPHPGGESFIIRDAKGRALAYVYFEDQTVWQMSMKRLTRDEACRAAVNIAKLRELLQTPRIT
jgi:hypothetical protein